MDQNQDLLKLPNVSNLQGLSLIDKLKSVTGRDLVTKKQGKKI